MFEGIPPCAGVRDAARDGTSFPVDPADAVAAMRVIEAVRTSALEHRVVRLGGPR
jgi:predicted dehydrogenase